jgi:hypothetical protein
VYLRRSFSRIIFQVLYKSWAADYRDKSGSDALTSAQHRRPVFVAADNLLTEGTAAKYFGSQASIGKRSLTPKYWF